VGYTRREFLGAAAAAAALSGLGLPACSGLAPRPRSGPFLHGVASGDPLADRVVLWTRVTPPPGREAEPVRVAWCIARDPALSRPVAEGVLATGPARDHTVKVDAVGLEPGGIWYYGFEAGGSSSPIGRTRTLPLGALPRLRLAVVSCSNYPQGFFNAYAAIARRADLDLVLHLGDYLYEYANGGYGDGTPLGRVPEPVHEIVTLADYRTRHAQYKRDPDLQALHGQHPVVAVWDDHESANDAWRDGAQNHDPSEGAWATRRSAAIRAWFEWMPVRELPGEASGPARIYRSLRFGDLADLVMLDTRLSGRDAQVERNDWAGLEDPHRSLLGPVQEAWLQQQLSASKRDGVAWRLIGQQVMFAPLARPGTEVNPDQWDGYRASRARILEHLAADAIDDVVILTGDIHSSWALDVARDPFSARGYDPATGRGSLAVELVTPAVSSSPLGSFERARERLARVHETHPHLKFVDLEHRGYVLLDLDRERAQAEWYFVETVTERDPREHLAAAFHTRRGANHLEAVPGPAASGHVRGA
jgi:alkaline phosphatase D